MTSRLLASLALGTAVVLGATGCSIVAPQATTIPYSPAEGVNVPASGPLQVRNALLVADDAGTSANFLAAIVNDTDSPETLQVTVDGETQIVRVAGRTTVSLGFDGDEPLLFTRLDAAAGTNLDVAFQSGDGESVVTDVPVLDGALDYLADFVPED